MKKDKFVMKANQVGRLVRCTAKMKWDVLFRVDDQNIDEEVFSYNDFDQDHRGK